MITVMTADDEELERDYLKAVFDQQREKYRLVAQAKNGKQAVEMASRHKPDVILMDINMPKLNGIDAARRIRRESPGQIIILNSAYADFEFARLAVVHRLDGYLLKPAGSNEIFAAITDCLQLRDGLRCGEDAHTPAAHLEELKGILERMQKALSVCDAQRFSAHAARFLARLECPGQPVDTFRLYAIHTLFSIEKQLHKLGYPASMLALLNGDEHIHRLENVATWDALRAVVELFFSQAALVLASRGAAKQDVVGSVCHYIQEHCMESITLGELAQSVHFSQSYLSRVFHQKMKMTLRSYITKQRLEKAVQLLQQTNRKSSDIALECGFRNLSHFHRVFKEHTGKTPAMVRAQGGAKPGN